MADLREADVENTAKIILVAQSILSHYYGFIVPDKTFYLQISVGQAVERISKQHEVKEIYEEKGLLERVKTGYDWLEKEFPDEIITINAEQDVDKVTQDLVKNLQ